MTELSPEQRVAVQELNTQRRRKQRAQPGVLDQEAEQRRELRALPGVLDQEAAQRRELRALPRVLDQEAAQRRRQREGVFLCCCVGYAFHSEIYVCFVFFTTNPHPPLVDSSREFMTT